MISQSKNAFLIKNASTRAIANLIVVQKWLAVVVSAILIMALETASAKSDKLELLVAVDPFTLSVGALLVGLFWKLSKE